MEGLSVSSQDTVTYHNAWWYMETAIIKHKENKRRLQNNTILVTQKPDMDVYMSALKRLEGNAPEY